MSTPASNPLWDHAKQNHLAGRLPEAEALYRQLLSQEPANPATLHMLGILQYQLGDREAALELINRAIAIDAGVPEYHGHRGLILASAGETGQAIEAYRQALAIAPRMPDVLNNLANAARAGDVTGAIGAYHAAAEVKP